MKLSESINFVPFYDKIKTQSMPAALAYRLAKLYKKTCEDQDFYQDKLREILFQYGELDEQGNLIPIEDGKGIKLKPDQQDACIAAITELQNTESDISFDPISLDDLAGIELTPTDIDSIMSFLA